MVQAAARTAPYRLPLSRNERTQPSGLGLPAGRRVTLRGMDQPEFIERGRAYQRQYYLDHREQKLAYQAGRREANRDEINARKRKQAHLLTIRRRGIVEADKRTYNRRYHREVLAETFLRQRLRVLQIVSGTARPACDRCGEMDVLVLQINHRNGGGRREVGTTTYRMFTTSIIDGSRDTADLNILCANCNIRYEYDRGARHLPRDWVAVVEDELSGARLSG